MDEDLNTYYLLSYSPKNQDFNGQFRQINVKVNRSGVEVQARKGYYALDSSYDTPVLHYEAPALALLGSKSAPPPNAFNSRVAAFNFNAPGGAGLVPVMVEVPSSSINFVSARRRSSTRTNFRSSSSSGRVAARGAEVSNQYILGGPLDNLEEARRGQILFYARRSSTGRYTVSSIVYDATNGRARVRKRVRSKSRRGRLATEAQQHRPHQERRAEPRQTHADPFNFGEVLLTRNMGEPVRKSAGNKLAFFVTGYPRAGLRPAAR